MKKITRLIPFRPPTPPSPKAPAPIKQVAA